MKNFVIRTKVISNPGILYKAELDPDLHFGPLKKPDPKPNLAI